ncbi:MAG: 6-phosphofructokinase [Bacilli bacterium]|jgi:6-phosphofructokinase 1|nr:6-phosphofructokinase [Bacilli bacterium]
MAKKIGVFTSGGDAPGMNACIRAIVRCGLQRGFDMFGINDGYRGLLEDDIVQMTRHSVSEIINRGGTILGTARLPEFKELEVQKKAVEILKRYGIDALVGIGGDGTYRGLAALSKLGINTIGLPGTIDNDVGSSDFTIGFDTALNTIIECVDRLRDTSSSHQRCSIIEVMGNRCGDLAAYAGLATGAELTITPETPITKEAVIEFLRQQRAEGKKHAIIIISEKITDVHEFAREIEARCGFETRAEVLGHMQRGGTPTASDRVLASRMGVYAVDLIAQGLTSVCVGIVNNQMHYYDIEKAIELPRHSSAEFVRMSTMIG